MYTVLVSPHILSKVIVNIMKVIMIFIGWRVLVPHRTEIMTVMIMLMIQAVMQIIMMMMRKKTMMARMMSMRLMMIL